MIDYCITVHETMTIVPASVDAAAAAKTCVEHLGVVADALREATLGERTSKQELEEVCVVLVAFIVALVLCTVSARTLAAGVNTPNLLTCFPRFGGRLRTLRRLRQT